MKNLFLLPTEKPSRLWINNLLQGKLELSKEVLKGSNTAQNIYITNDEEIKEGDWFMDITLNNYGKVYKSAGLSKSLGYENWIKSTTNIVKEPITQCKKIILTDNKDLIEDGVQEITDDFLEWFVKNPSCDFVEINKYAYAKPNFGNYKIIFPKEETKQETTLEEFIKKQLSLGKYQDQESAIRHSIELGAKWQQEQDKKIYSEEDMLNFAWFLIENIRQYSCDRTAHFEGKYLEQFKKKQNYDDNRKTNS